MFGSDIIEVAIGMAFLYLFMSMIASALRESIEAFMKKRAVDLERGLREMLRTDTTGSDPNPRGLTDMLRGLLPSWLVGTAQQKGPNFNTWAGHLYAHPIVASLFAGTYEQAKAGKTLPSYVPKESFSLALLDFLAGASANGEVLSLERLKASLNVPNPNDVQRVVLAAISTADDDLGKVRKAIETWYDATMDRVSGWYARRTAMVLFVIGFGAALALNVDSITVVKSLLTDRPLRQAIVAKAEAYSKAHAVDADTKSETSAASPDSFERLRTEMDEVGFPIGWTMKDGWPMPIPQACTRQPAADAKAATVYDCSRTNYVWMLLIAFMGWLITAIAIMLGAPFWFDMLNKFISVRAALKPPELPAPAKPAKSSDAAPAGGAVAAAVP